MFDPTQDPYRAQVDLNMAEVHDVSVGLLTALSEAELTQALAIAGTALTLGRLMSPKLPLTEEDEIAFIQNIMGYVTTYWTGGGIN